MAKKRARQNDPTPFLPNLGSTALYRRRRPLFLPRLLREEAGKQLYRGPDQDEAHSILQRWAALESEGHLAKKETSLDAEFLHEVFGKALGYKTSTESPDAYHLEREFTVPGIGTADGALGRFPLKRGASPIAVIELKASDVHLDRDRFNGRTPVQQCWDYLNALPDCSWGIVSNFVTIRLYHREKGSLAFEEFSLRELRELTRFREFYCLFHLRGLVEPTVHRPPRASLLLELTTDRQRSVGDELYESYSQNRLRLIHHLHREQERPLDTAIRIAQKILDRIIFIAFCEDRDLLPQKVIESTIRNVPPFDRATNPRWRNFLRLFEAVDRGHPDLNLEQGYNGGLFQHDPEVDDLQLDDDWTNFFRSVSRYDFRDEVNVDVLGHLFEKSITELEKMRVGGLFGSSNGDDSVEPAMTKSAQRKRFGIYYTPPDFTAFIVAQTVGQIISERSSSLASKHSIDPDQGSDGTDDRRHLAFWMDFLAALRDITICDPACGSGAFLMAAYELLEENYVRVADNLEILGQIEQAASLRETFTDIILADNLFGVDLSVEAVEITQLALWIRSARRGRTLADLSGNIVCGNSLVTDHGVHKRAMSWQDTFPGVFARQRRGFDCVIGNPPWERLKLQEREFFAFSAPKIAGAVSAATRRRLISALERENPELYERYLEAKEQADRTLTHARTSGEYPLTAKGDINTYVLFAELAGTIVCPSGLVGLLVPSGIASDKTTRQFFNELMADSRLVSLYDFENRRGIFADLHRSFKFSTLVFGGQQRQTKAADFVFFAHSMADLKDRQRHVPLSARDMAMLNPNTKTCPIFRSPRDAQLTKSIYKRIPILIDETRKSAGNPWGIKFVRMFDQTNDAELFHTAEQLTKKRYGRDGSKWKRGKSVFLLLYEAKMVQMYDHRAASVVVEKDKWIRQGQTRRTSLVEHQNPEFVVEPRWWVSDTAVRKALEDRLACWYLCYKDVTSPTNERTMIAAFIPHVGVVNSAPLVLTGQDISPRRQCCLLANINAVVYDFVARQKVGGVHLNFFIVKQLPTIPPDAYANRCPWSAEQDLEEWISDRVLKLTCTADDMRPLAEATGLKPSVHKWNPEERAQLQAELDAAFFLLYGVKRKDVEYILSTFSGTRRRDESQFGSFRTASLLLDAYDELNDAC